MLEALLLNQKKFFCNQPFLAEKLFIFSRKGSSTQNSSNAFKADTYQWQMAVLLLFRKAADVLCFKVLLCLEAAAESLLFLVGDT